MPKKHRKQKPSMLYWWWLDADGYWFCKNKNGCSNCFAAKHNMKEKKRRNKRVERKKDYELSYERS